MSKNKLKQGRRWEYCVYIFQYLLNQDSQNTNHTYHITIQRVTYTVHNNESPPVQIINKYIESDMRLCSFSFQKINGIKEKLINLIRILFPFAYINDDAHHRIGFWIEAMKWKGLKSVHLRKKKKDKLFINSIITLYNHKRTENEPKHWSIWILISKTDQK